MSQGKDYAAIEKELRGKILNIRNSYQDILDGFAAAKKEKMSTKARYHGCIDLGSESGLRDCLKIIRECNSVIEGLPASREEFFGKFAEVEDQYRIFMGIDQQQIVEAQANLDKASKVLKELKERSTRVSGIRVELNTLKNLIIGSGDVASSSEDDKI